MFPEPKVKRFLDRYQKLIETYKSVNVTIHENHHILPKCLGGKNDTCIHCGKIATVFNISRWHNNNCKTNLLF